MRRPNRRGFTVLELLVSISLTMAAIGIAIPFFLAQSRSLEASSGRLDAQLNINFGLDAMDRDLRIAGVGITQRQPLLVQMASDAITFNGDLASGLQGDVTAVYYDPDAPPGATSMLSPANKVTLPNSSWQYPDSAYWSSPGVPTSAETISYYVVPDSQSPGLFKLMRRANDATPRVMARGIKAVAGEPWFRYFKLNVLGALVEIPQGSLPRRHPTPWHGAPGDTNQVALVDSVRLIRVKFTGVHRDPRYPDAIRVEERTIRIMNAGLVRASTCGDAPLAASALVGVADGTPSVTLTWTASVDEGAGEKDIERYAIYRRLPLALLFDEPIAAIAAGQAAPMYVDTDVKPGDTWVYGVSAQDCTPSSSSMITTGTIVVP
jgi:hypothetical protein